MRGDAEFPAIDQAAKAASLVFAMASSDEAELSMDQVRAIGRAARLNPKRELEGFLELLEGRRLIERTGDSVNVMRLLKPEVDEIALQVLKRGDANAQVLEQPPSASMSGYDTPEETRWSFRRSQGAPSRKATFSVIEALRSNRGF
jgi:hypothetical protein